MTDWLYVDTHCHLDRYPDPRSILAGADRARVVTIAVTESPSAFQRQAALMRGAARLRIAIGMHPLAAHRISAVELSLFRRMIDRTDYVGEVGLDFSQHGRATRDVQQVVFGTVLSHPEIKSKILTVHSRGAEAAVIDRLAAARTAAILHWYSGPIGLIKSAIDAGLFFSVNPAMLRSRKGRRIVEAIPPDRVLTETDGPYTKVGTRASEPSDVPAVISALAERWSVSPEVAGERVYGNMIRLARSRLPHAPLR